MNVSNEQLVEEAVAGLLRATRANDAETSPARHSRQTDQCPNIARFAAVFRCGDKWSQAESAHVLSCGFCLDVMRMFTTAASVSTQGDTETLVNMDTGHETHVAPPKKAKESKPSGDKPKSN